MITASQSADKLPFPNGSYASQPRFCKMTRAEALEIYEFALYDIKGKEISNYETFCEVRDVLVKGSKVQFKRVCESEGESVVERVAWKKLGPKSFADNQGTVWTSCGRFID
jgi:hypothetical protein